MPTLEALKYRGFLSYAHADTRWARWLHRRLESFRIDKDLVGEPMPIGPVPSELRPIFRDREDFTGGHSLTDATISALDQSAALIVVCSVASATRPAVNEEVRLFRHRHPERPVIPVIVNGSYPDNFAPALRFEITADGAVSNRPITILGPDLRDTSDGKALGIAKIVAGLIGVATDEIVRRAERDQHRRLRNWFAGLSMVIIGLAGLTVWAEINRREAISQKRLAEQNLIVAKQAARALVTDIARSLRNQQGLRSGTVRNILGTAETTIKALSDTNANNEDLLEIMGDMFVEFADSYESQLDDAMQEEAAKKSLHIREKLATSSRQTENRRIALAQSLERVGSALMHRDPALAQPYFIRALSINEAVTSELPYNTAAQNDLGVVMEKMGDSYYLLGHRSEALKRYIQSKAIFEALARSSNDNRFTRSHWASSIKIGQTLLDLNQYDESLAIFRKAVDSAHRLLASNIDNTEYQSDLGNSYGFLGNAFLQKNLLDEALQAFETKKAMFRRLIRSDPGRSIWQREYAVSFTSIGNVFARKRDLVAAEKNYRESIAAGKQQAENGSIDADDLINNHLGLAEVGLGRGDSAMARAELLSARRIASLRPNQEKFKRAIKHIDSQLAKLAP